MKKNLLQGVIIAGGCCLAATSANADILTFDDLTTGTSTYQINSLDANYGGLTWDNDWNIMNSSSYDYPSGYINGTVSGDYIAYNAWAQVTTINDANFDFNGTYLTGAWNDGLSIDVIGTKNGVEVYSQTVTVNTMGPTWFDFNFLDIDNLSFYSYGGTKHAGLVGSGDHFAMDDFTFNQTEPVPEPATMLLFGTGLAGLAGLRLRKKKN